MVNSLLVSPGAASRSFSEEVSWASEEVSWSDGATSARDTATAVVDASILHCFGPMYIALYNIIAVFGR